MRDNVVRDKSYIFVLRVVKTYKLFCSEKKAFVLSKQFLRGGTAIGAMIGESKFVQNKADFINKMSVSLKESNETLYWLNILKDSDILECSAEPLIRDADELIFLLSSMVKNSKSTLNA